MRPIRILAALAWLALAVTMSPTAVAAPRSLWEFSPYRVQVLVALDVDPTLTPALIAELGRDVQSRIEAVVGAPWQVETFAAPPILSHAMRWRFERVTAADLPSDTLEGDKAMLVHVARVGSDYQVIVRDFDIRTRVLGAAVTQDAADRSLLASVAVDAVLQAFAPLGEIDVVEMKTAQVRLRAAALPTRDPNLTVLERGDAFLPVLRFNNADGSLKNVRTTPWSFLTYDAEAKAPRAKDAPPPAADEPPAELDPGVIVCRIHSGLRSPLSSRRRGRSEQLALAVTPNPASTRVEMFSATDSEYPLAGYEVYAQPPASKASKLLGLTDSRGGISIPPAPEHPLRILIIKNGGEPVARLPVLAGWEPHLKALVNNDEARLRVEGYITGLQERVVDTVARRNLLLARIRARISAGKIDEAEAMFKQAKALPNLADFQQELHGFERTVQTNEARLKKKIDKLFLDTRQVVEKHLAEEPLNEVSDLLEAAK